MGMRTTTDLYTGERFQWSSSVRVVYDDLGFDLATPARTVGSMLTDHLAPTRVPLKLLEELNPGVDVMAELSKLGELLPASGRSRWDGRPRP